jgi:hypothetical protein
MIQTVMDVSAHTQVLVEQNDRSAEVDEGIADLILALWERSMWTTGSCENQDEMGFAWVAFERLEDAHEFERVSGGKVITLDEGDYVADDGTRLSDDGGAAAVAFPSQTISGVTTAVRQSGEVRAATLGRNDPCFCGSGRKFKRCHGR